MVFVYHLYASVDNLYREEYDAARVAVLYEPQDMQLSCAEGIPESQVLRWTVLAWMVNHDLVIFVGIGALDLLSDVLALLVAHADFLFLVAKFFDRLSLVTLSESKHCRCDYALKATDEEVE